MPEYACERLSQADHSFLVYEGPDAPLHVAVVHIHELEPLRDSQGGPDVERIREYVLSRLSRIPRYRQRLAYTPLERHPVWVDDPHFDVRDHVRRARLPRPGSERLLQSSVARILSKPLDRGRPLWEMWALGGLQDERFAIVTKVHHCMVDGVAGVELLAALMTPEPSERIGTPPPWCPRPAPTPAQLLREEALRGASAPLRLGSLLWRLARDEQGARAALAERARATAAVVSSAWQGTSPTPFNERIGRRRRIEWLPMELGAIREVKRRLGGSVNDVVLATVAGAVRRFLAESRGVDVDRLRFRVMAPVSTRSEGERDTFGNRASAWIVDLPVGEPDPRRRLEKIRETTAELKRSKQELGVETLSQIGEWTGSALLALSARLGAVARPPFNMVVTNVPGPPRTLYLLGSRLLEARPVVPLMGKLALGIALLSYGGTLCWGFNADWARMPDLHDFVGAVGESFAELCGVAPL